MPISAAERTAASIFLPGGAEHHRFAPVRKHLAGSRSTEWFPKREINTVMTRAGKAPLTPETISRDFALDYYELPSSMNLLKRLADNSDPNSLAVRMRRARFAFFTELLAGVSRPVRILDVGGTGEFWRLMGALEMDDIHITLYNLDESEIIDHRKFTSEIGDAMDLTRYADQSFDIVFSNSVIEHLGPRFADQRRMADEIRRVGKRYFVQTPNRYFPLEPHFLTPGFQFMPLDLRVWLVRHFSVGWYSRIPDAIEARREVERVSLLSRAQLAALFPEARIHTESFLTIPKSYVAFHGW